MDFFTVPRARRAIIYTNIMVFLGQFTGINAIQYYMATLMQQVGFDNKQSVFILLVGGGSLLLGTIPAILYIEKFGRRYLISLSNKSGSQGTYIAGLIVIPSEIYPIYLRLYSMETSDVTLFLCSFLVTYFFAQIQEAMSRIGLTLGFYKGIAVLGWFYQILFMSETKNKTLEEIDIIFSQPTNQLIKENFRNAIVTANDFVCFKWGKAFSPVSESNIFRKENGHKTEMGP
ncbi:putative sugar transport protein 9 [Hyaloscypha finlandica]|nr:putative sugar transport protein 9 [Hyaloscypha finlandica]